jgi:anhydro-N-acetylmuramic acid kinase
MLSLGLMSGTSLDGVDAALILTDGTRLLEHGPALTRAYPQALRRALRALFGGAAPASEVAQVERAMTLFHAEVAAALLASAGLTADRVGLVGFHGQTILHRPDQRRTWQIGDGALLASRLGMAVVNDFRSADVAAGGQGAPLVPVYHQALARDLERPLAVLNLGGVGNVTWIGAGEEAPLLAFDTGPGNALLDDWVARLTGAAFDQDGRLAAAGTVDGEAVAAFSQAAYFSRTPPKSLDRDDFQALAGRLVGHLSAADGAATLVAFTVQAVRLAAAHFPMAPRRWLVCGGGRRNPAILTGLRQALGVPVDPVEVEGWDGDALEAEAFAFLAVRSALGLPQTWPGTTGAPRPLTGGRLNRPISPVGPASPPASATGPASPPATATVGPASPPASATKRPN